MADDDALTDPIAARHQQVLASGPRLAPLAPDEMTEDTLVFNRRIHKVAGRERGPFTLENVPDFVATMMRHPRLFQLQTDVGLFLISEGELPARERELVILRVAWLLQAPYQWGEHVLMSRSVGLTSADTQALTEGSGHARWTEGERAVMRAVEELVANTAIGDEAWAALAERFSDRQLMEIVLLVGQYQQLANFLNAFRIQLHQGNEGLRAR